MLKSYIDRLCRESGLDEEFVDEGKNQWSFFIDQRTSMILKEESEKITFLCDLGPAPQKISQLEDMLYANLACCGTYGSVLGLDKTLQKAIIWRSFSPSTGYESFKTELKDFANCAEYWSYFVRSEQMPDE